MIDSTQLNDSYLMEKKFEFMLESINKKAFNSLNALKNMISSIEIEVAGIKKQIKDMQGSSPKAFESTNVANDRREIQPKARDNGAVKPRYGDYEPEDVPIEKFFYFGNKR